MKEFKFKKKYGQNFLNNSDIVSKIVNSIKPSNNDLIIEVGPGGGAITTKLKEHNANVIAFEIDTDTKEFLEKLEDDKTTIIYDDFLIADIKKILNEIDYEKLYIVGNLPYYITTPIIDRIIELDLNEESLTIMVQKEVAKRFLAKPHNKEYGYMTVILNYWFDIDIVCEVNRKEFTPIPNVDSTVLILRKKENIPVDYKKFQTLLKNAFKFKRKVLKNNLNGYDLKKIESILLECGYNLSNRAEDIDVDTYIKLTNEI